MRHRFYIGLGFTKIEAEVIKVSVNSRVMIDPQTFRHTNPNYPISTVQPAERDHFAASRQNGEEQECSSGGNIGVLEMEVEDDGNIAAKESTRQDNGQNGQVESKFTEEDLLISSPLVLGFSLSDKLWLEFTVSGIKDIQWNESAFDSLVLPEGQKSIVKRPLYHVSIGELGTDPC